MHPWSWARLFHKIFFEKKNKNEYLVKIRGDKKDLKKELCENKQWNTKLRTRSNKNCC